MVTKNLKDLSNSDLLKYEKQIKVITYTLLAMLIFLLGLGIYVTINNHKMSALIAIPFGLLAIVFMNFAEIKRIKVEKSSRKI